MDCADPEDGDPWPNTPDAKVSDEAILRGLVHHLSLAQSDPVTIESFYEGFQQAKKASDDWIKYHMISVALLIIAVSRASPELSLFGTKVTGAFIAPTAILYFSVCTMAYTSHELKMRLFRIVFKEMLEGLRGARRAEVLMRFPLAYAGTEFLPAETRPNGWTISGKQVLQSLPLIAVMKLAWMAAVFGLMGLLFYAIFMMFTDPGLPLPVSGCVLICFLEAMIFSSKLLRDPKVKHGYERSDPRWGVDRSDR